MLFALHFLEDFIIWKFVLQFSQRCMNYVCRTVKIMMMSYGVRSKCGYTLCQHLSLQNKESFLWSCDVEKLGKSNRYQVHLFQLQVSIVIMMMTKSTIRYMVILWSCRWSWFCCLLTILCSTDDHAIWYLLLLLCTYKMCILMLRCSSTCFEWYVLLLMTHIIFQVIIHTW